MKVDLHIHSTASDGRLTPEEIVRLAAERELEVIALTDHDSVAGIAPALREAKAFPRLQVIPAVEMAAEMPYGEIHILGYFIDYKNSQLLKTLEWLRHSREQRAMKMIAKLKSLGILVDYKRVRELAAGESLGRPHIAQAMVERGYARCITEAFNKYIDRGGPAYVPREKIRPEELIQLILKAQGLPVLAHPLSIGVDEEELERLLTHFKANGLAGLEAYYEDYQPSQQRRLVEIAHKHELIISGGSDYHGLEDTETPLCSIAIPEAEIIPLLTFKQIYASGSGKT